MSCATSRVCLLPASLVDAGFLAISDVSMGIGPINSIYQARFLRYLENREIIPKTTGTSGHFWAMAKRTSRSRSAPHCGFPREARQSHFVVNCNLQRLDGPVRGNGSIIQELEGVFRGAGWNVIKVLWGSDWDELFARDTSGLLLKRMEECVDGEYQNFKARGRRLCPQRIFREISRTAETRQGQ